MTHDERVYHHLYIESKSPLENAERIAALEELVEELQDKNAMLREERREYQATIDSLVDECTDHNAENAKLRELVRDLWMTGSLCDAIPDMRLQAKGGDWRTMQERVDEALGIEVTE